MVMRAILTFCLPQVFSPFFLSFGEKIFVGSERKTPPNLIFFLPPFVLTKQKKMVISPLFLLQFSILVKTTPTRGLIPFVVPKILVEIKVLLILLKTTAYFNCI